MTYTKKIATAIATGAVLLSSVAPAFAADTSIVISGNGRNTDNTAAVAQTNTTTVSQTNNAQVNNTTNVTSNTGNNKASDNLGGGSVSVTSGDATTNVTNKTMANTNTADVANCGCTTSTDVLVSGNGRNSTNNVGLTQTNTTSLTQDNRADVNNTTNITSNTGRNSANDNNSGNVQVQSGSVSNTVDNKTAVNANVAQVGAGAGAGSNGNGAVSLRILDNGRNSDNTIGLDLRNSATVRQDNSARVNNTTDIDAQTGNNHASDNLGGGMVEVMSGDANSSVSNDTMANFNAAALDACGCDTGVLAKIAGNLRDSDNTIGASLSNAQNVFQSSGADVNNTTNDHSNTGSNKANDNGGVSLLSDPSVTSGDAGSDVSNHNAVNQNVVGNGLTLPMPTGGNVTLTFDGSSMFSNFWGWMVSHM